MLIGRALSFMILLAASLLPLTDAPNASARELRVCADQNNLPFSKSDGSGFENRIANIIAAELGASVQYTWHAQRRGFIRTTLNAGLCDVIMGVPSSIHMLRPTRPYYRSSYAFVQRADAKPVTSFNDPRLKTLRIGVQLIGNDGVNTPPAHDLARRGIVENVRGYLVQNDYSEKEPLAPIIEAVAKDDIDVAIAWGPTAGYFAARQPVSLKVTPIALDPTALDLALTYDISMGVRKDDLALLDELNQAIANRKDQIDAVLAKYGVPNVAHK
ncbi:MAG TPA: substrate-binding domain-containing protein [Hyphomicrobium sp.]|nr:substrate-binding domain-containing protein [Hyphomicrobium sp.]